MPLPQARASARIEQRDRLLDLIRDDPQLVALLAEAKGEWERLKAEFGTTTDGR